MRIAEFATEGFEEAVLQLSPKLMRYVAGAVNASLSHECGTDELQLTFRVHRPHTPTKQRGPVISPPQLLLACRRLAVRLHLDIGLDLANEARITRFAKR